MEEILCPFLNTFSLNKNYLSMMAHVYNPNYLGNWRRDYPRSAWATKWVLRTELI